MRIKPPAGSVHASIFILVLAGIVSLIPAGRAVPAFPGAEGWGAAAVGGRGGAVLHVTNLNNSGPGSFRAACEASGPRTVVFDVSGIIQLTNKILITNSCITIAGHTAPGDGIIVAGDTVDLNGGVSDVVVRYMRFRRSYDKAKWAAWVAKPRIASSWSNLAGKIAVRIGMMRPPHGLKLWRRPR